MLRVEKGSRDLQDEASQEELQRPQLLLKHSAALTCAAWSYPHSKLITGDAAGAIIVWAQKDGDEAWREEMANKRQAPLRLEAFISPGTYTCIWCTSRRAGQFHVYTTCCMAALAESLDLAYCRPGTQVVDIAWSPDGHDVCIAYDDGFVIRGGFAGGPHS